MIVEMTSLTPRAVLRTPAMPAQAAPTTTATISAATTLRKPPTNAAPANVAAVNEAIVYWPSMPMLNRPMRNPIAAATAAM
jgi:hypothetical protein